MSVESVPEYWGCHKLGYVFMVNTASLHNQHHYLPYQVMIWLHTQLGSLGDGAWIDAGSYVCFQNLADAQWSDITWHS